MNKGSDTVTKDSLKNSNFREGTNCDSEPTRQSIRELLEKSQKDAVGVLGVSLEQAADFFRGKQAGDSEKADEAKTMATLRNRTAAEALKDVRLALLFAMHHNFRARCELIRAGQIRVMDKAQLQAVNERIKKGEIGETERASSYISAEEWSEDRKMAELMNRELSEARFNPDEERVIRERLEILTLILSRPLSLTMTQLVRE
jgi:hypothetical protein